MRAPTIKGIIDRRILANFRIDADYMAKALPPPFRPQLIDNYAIGGICLIRLKQVRPKFLPLPWGISSENAAHRIAVQWDENGDTKQGVYIPRRDTDSCLNALASHHVFPSVFHYASFIVDENDTNYSVTMNSHDGATSVHVSGTVAQNLPDSSIFGSIQDASEFFEQGALGYSDARIEGQYDGIELQCQHWHVEALDVESIRSSYFEDLSRFPVGAVEFDCALLMQNIVHEWHGRPDLCCPTKAA